MDSSSIIILQENLKFENSKIENCHFTVTPAKENK
jgi:hypothetical protein